MLFEIILGRQLACVWLVRLMVEEVMFHSPFQKKGGTLGMQVLFLPLCEVRSIWLRGTREVLEMKRGLGELATFYASFSKEF